MLGALPGAERVYTRWIAPRPEVARELLSDGERGALETLGREVRGRLVWSSNREGNHELYLAELGSGRVTRLTDHPHVDFFSRFSPDGRHISFLRSQRPWVSFREHDAWDLYVMPVEGGEERRLVEGAYHPTWLPDGSALMFVKENRIMTVDWPSGREQVLHDGAEPPTRGTVEEPEPFDDGLVAITLRDVPTETVGVLDLRAKTYTAVSDVRACQITWVPGRREVVWIESGGRGDKQVMHADLTTGRPASTILMDLPGRYSHEYFPRVAGDGDWLVWGAAAEGHEHDRADYEIFAWKRGTPWTAAQRVTHSPANDQWPDLYVTP
jgi:hypothetical protein